MNATHPRDLRFRSLRCFGIRLEVMKHPDFTVEHMVATTHRVLTAANG